MKFCLIGKKLSHSYSKIIHNYLGLDYELCEVLPEKVGDFVKNNDYDGFNVTIPYKREVMPYLDYISTEALKVGAVNTVVRKNGKLLGYNTDYIGLVYTFNKMQVDLKNKGVLILGTGGASEAVEAVCSDLGAKFVIKVGRTSKVNYENIYEVEGVNIIVNATPVGMYPKLYEKLINLEKFTELEACLDLIYNPLKTEFVLDAERLKLKVSNGLNMLVEQGIAARDIWLNETHSVELTEEVYNFLYKQVSNVVLTGMPSCGKSSIGKKVARLLNKEFVDVDEYITNKQGKTPSEIILSNGEKVFRDIETEAVREISVQGGKVISTGGGSVLREENVRCLNANGIIFYIKRDLDKLTSKNRPLSAQKGIETLFNERKEIYERTANVIIDNNGEFLTAVEKVIKEYENFSN